jgi:UDP-2,4-diacetamido-2,4,6-trideoxy-beta-L-altropyranose hydrolase
MPPKNILIRCDASSTIGTGHVMRDLVLAARFSAESLSFATRPLEGNLDTHIEKNGYKVHSLRTNGVAELGALIGAHAIDLLIIDHYELGFAFEKALKKNHPSLTIMVLDDTYEKHYCDILLNHNIYAQIKRYKHLVPKGCLLQCGAKYTLLRDEFLETREVAKSDTLLIAMGGADTQNLSLKILACLPEDFSWHVNIITTHANKNLAELQTLATADPRINLHIQTTEFARLAKEARLAIISPSGVANELYALQTPFIAVQTAPNQKYMRRFLKKKGYGVLKKFSCKKLKTLIKSSMP